MKYSFAANFNDQEKNSENDFSSLIIKPNFITLAWNKNECESTNYFNILIYWSIDFIIIKFDHNQISL